MLGDWVTGCGEGGGSMEQLQRAELLEPSIITPSTVLCVDLV